MGITIQSADGSPTVPEQIAAATDEAFADTAHLTARKADGTLLKRTWANVKAALFGAVIDLTGGGIKFPAVQVPSADANVFDDYEEGTWTPALSFATPGNLSIAYTTQVGSYTKIGRLVTLNFNITTSTFTHTTASGNAQITTVPFTPATGANFVGTLIINGITKANYTMFGTRISSASTTITLSASASGQGASSITAADMPTGGTIVLQGTVSFEV